MSTHGNAKSAFLMTSAAFSLSFFLHFPKSARARNKVEALQPRSFVRSDDPLGLQADELGRY